MDLGISSVLPGLVGLSHMHGPSMVGHGGTHRAVGTAWGQSMATHLQPGHNSGTIPVGKGQSFPPSLFQEFVPGRNKRRRVIYGGLVGIEEVLEENRPRAVGSSWRQSCESCEGSNKDQGRVKVRRFPSPVPWLPSTSVSCWGREGSSLTSSAGAYPSRPEPPACPVPGGPGCPPPRQSAALLGKQDTLRSV